jgi:hypothetical protein
MQSVLHVLMRRPPLADSHGTVDNDALKHMTTLLLEKGVDSELVDIYNNKAVEVARKMNHDAGEEVLQDHVNKRLKACCF